jgi:uncharacterized membrane protein YkvA (DUF1232 family)
MDWSVVWGIAASLLAAWLLVVILLWLARPRDIPIAEVLRIVPDVVLLGRRLVGDPTVPLGVRAAVVALIAWLINPIDLIPEFIPVLGPLDDVVAAVLVLRYVRGRLGEPELRRRWPGTDDGYRLLSGVLDSSTTTARRAG